MTTTPGKRVSAPIVYGIPNCDTVKKARTWLDQHGVGYTFHDYKKQGVPADELAAWCKAHGWERVLNRAGTTFRKLPEADKAKLDQAKVLALMTAQPSLIKRPIVDTGGDVLIGFDVAVWVTRFT